MIGEEIVVVVLVWRFEVMIDGHCWVSLGVGGQGLVMCVVVGHFVEVAVVVECWEEEEEEVEGDWEEEEVVVSYLVGVEGSGGVGE